MLSNNDHSGIFTFLIGLIAVVMAGVGLSLVADRKFSVPRSDASLNYDIQLAAPEIERLQEDHGIRADQLAGREQRAQADAQALTSLRDQMAAQAKRLEILSATRDKLKETIPLTREEFARYRAAYRTQTWENAMGQDLGTLKLRGGREYRQCVIQRVTEVGLEIHHAEGMARIQAPDLAPEIQDRFQWNEEERRQVLAKEREHQQPVAGSPNIPVPNPKPIATPTANPTPDPEQLKRLRTAVSQARSKVTQFSSQLRDARVAASSNQTSVPGTLETWRNRIARLETSLANASAELAVARVNLADVAPADPMLNAATSP